MLKDYGTPWGFHEKPSKHLTVFSPETLNIKNVANLTANTKNYGQITLNTNPHSDPHLISVSPFKCFFAPINSIFGKINTWICKMKIRKYEKANHSHCMDWSILNRFPYYYLFSIDSLKNDLLSVLSIEQSFSGPDRLVIFVYQGLGGLYFG